MSQGTFTGSDQSTYCSEAEITVNLKESIQQLQPRRSKRLILMEMIKRTRSPQLFEEIETECSQIICGQMSNTTDAPVGTKILRITQGPPPAKIKNEVTEMVRLRQGKTVKRSLKAEEIEMPPVKRKEGCLTQLPVKQRSTNPRTRGNKSRNLPKQRQPKGSQPKTKRGRSLKGVQHQEFLCGTNLTQSSQSQQQTISTKPQEIQAHASSINLSYQLKQKAPLQYKKSFSLPSSPSKLPSLYPAHFIHQLPPLQDTNENAIALSPNSDSLSSHSSSSLSDSIAKIFGTKDVNLILQMKCPRKYYLLDDHLPAMAMMLGVEVGRLRSVMNFTQHLTHEQLVLWPQVNHQSFSNEN